ncbi:hypothetical protein [Winogradskyella forsetii]|uniref:hypothetical protein n=1 Tax=Winogradskyella forsetii TaxID=2686077 RepID=UPI0015C16761|nr:hypothetical protein [Winogradskyella forsetii]
MNFTPEETESIKKMFKFIVKKQHEFSDGKSGFRLNQLLPILEELEKETQIIKRPTINSYAYFLTTKKP